MTIPPLPDFARPPVIETVLGVQFSPITQFSIAHFGFYWARVRSAYPHAEDKPPLTPAFEEFGTPMSHLPKVGIELVSEVDARCWFIDKSRTLLVQVQRDRFIQNWRKVTGEEPYPRYASLKPRFGDEWQRFCQFLREEELPAPEVTQCEVTYVNHIEPGVGWNSYAEIHNVIAAWTAPSGNFLPGPEVTLINTKYLMPDKRGRLHIVVQPAVRPRDAKEVLQLTLTARGRPNTSGLDDILEWFDLGHEWIVRGFTDFTTTTMHEIWGRKA